MITSKLDWHGVVSSNLSKVAWIDGTLYIEFKDSSVYSYANVPEQTFENLLSADSPGRYFHSYIRDYFTTRQEN